MSMDMIHVYNPDTKICFPLSSVFPLILDVSFLAAWTSWPCRVDAVTLLRGRRDLAACLARPSPRGRWRHRNPACCHLRRVLVLVSSSSSSRLSSEIVFVLRLYMSVYKSIIISTVVGHCVWGVIVNHVRYHILNIEYTNLWQVASLPGYSKTAHSVHIIPSHGD